MGLAKLKTKIGVEEYLESEKISPVKREYIYGEVFEMPLTTATHNRIRGNIAGNLNRHLRESVLEVFLLSFKLKASPDIFYYPNVFVARDRNPESRYYREEPVLIAEVISPSTGEIDRREKLLFYQQMPSVQEYVIVEQEKMHIEIHRRQPDGRWITYYYNDSDLDEQIEFQSVGLKINLEEIYRRVKFDRRITET